MMEHRRLTEKDRRDCERALTRKHELRKDRSALYRYYNEYMEYFPLGRGERRNQYLSSLLANQPMPSDTRSDLGLAITYAQEHWEDYMEYPRDVSRASDAMKARLERQGK